MPKSSRLEFLGIGALIAVLSLAAGYIVLTLVNWGINWFWVTVPEQLGTPALWALAILLPAASGLAVVAIRKHGDDGHNPLFGLTAEPVTLKAYPTVLGAIVVCLFGGIVLGPEEALVATGAMVGTFVSSRTRLDIKPAAIIGVAGAVISLLVHPVFNNALGAASGYQFRWADLIGAAFIGLATGVVILSVRWFSVGILKVLGGDRPRYHIAIPAGALIGLVAMIYFSLMDQPISLVLTSGAGHVKETAALGSVTLILITLVAKWFTYGVSMGTGFRGGPFFPTILLGTSVGAMATLLFPDFAQGGTAAGIIAGIAYLGYARWQVTIGMAIFLSLLEGGFALIPLAIIAAMTARLIPGIKVSTKPTGEMSIHKMFGFGK